MAQAAAAQDLSQEQVQAPEQGIETAKSPEHGELGSALESGSKDKVVNLFKKDAQAEVEARKRLGLLETTEKQVSPEIASKIEVANDNSYKQIAEAEDLAIKQVDVALGEPANEAPPTPVAALVETSKPVEIPEPIIAPVVMEAPKPMAAVVEVPKPVEAKMVAPVTKNEMAEQQKIVAEEVMKEDLDALQSFAEEHGLHMNAETLEIPESELDNLTKTERTYIAVLDAKYRAGKASHDHAEALIAVAAETDPAKKKELAAHAFELSEEATVKEKAATILNSEYMALPEIAAMAAGNPTGGSYGGEAFQEQPPAGGAGPTGPEGPQGPNLTLIQGGKRTSGSEEPLYNDKTYGGPAGITIVTPVRAEGKGEKEKPSGVHGWFLNNFRALGGFFGGGGGGKDRH